MQILYLFYLFNFLNFFIKLQIIQYDGDEQTHKKLKLILFALNKVKSRKVKHKH